MKPARIPRHVWSELDMCIKCGVARHGYSGGRTGSLRYVWPDGHWTTRAGECPGRVILEPEPEPAPEPAETKP